MGKPATVDTPTIVALREQDAEADKFRARAISGDIQSGTTEAPTPQMAATAENIRDLKAQLGTASIAAKAARLISQRAQAMTDDLKTQIEALNTEMIRDIAASGVRRQPPANPGVTNQPDTPQP